LLTVAQKRTNKKRRGEDLQRPMTTHLTIKGAQHREVLEVKRVPESLLYHIIK